MGTKLFNLTFGLVAKLLRSLQRAGFTHEDVERLKERASEVLAFLREGTTPEELKGMSTELQLKRWALLYRELFDIELDIESITIPIEQKGFRRLIVVAPGLSFKQVIEALRSRFAVYLYTEELDADITSIRSTANGPYAIWVRDCREADKENRNKSANDFSQEDCETLMERLLHELVCFSETGEHLDIKCWTICAGSRDRDGRVPYVDWLPVARELGVVWCHADDRDSDSAVRSVVR